MQHNRNMSVLSSTANGTRWRDWLILTNSKTSPFELHLRPSPVPPSTARSRRAGRGRKSSCLWFFRKTEPIPLL